MMRPPERSESIKSFNEWIAIKKINSFPQFILPQASHDNTSSRVREKERRTEFHLLPLKHYPIVSSSRCCPQDAFN